MALNDEVNIYKKPGYSAADPLAAKLLGPIAKKKWARAIIRSAAGHRNDCLEYEVLIDKEALKKMPLRKGDVLIGTAAPLKHLKGIAWELVKYEVY